MNVDHSPHILPDERGIAFVVSLVTMLVLVILGYGLLVATDGSTRTETGMKAQTASFEAADSAIELAREKLRACLAGQGAAAFSCNAAGGRTFSQLLASVGGGIDSTTLAGFPGTTASTNGTGATPFVSSDSTTLSPTTFQVFMTNDPADDVTTTTDGASGTAGHNRVTLTAFASGANNVGYAVVQSVVEAAPLEGLTNEFPGTLVLPGPTVNFAPFNSNNGKILNTSPNCGATILVTSNASRSAVVDPSAGIPSNRLDTQHYTSCFSGGGTDTTNFGIYNLLPQALSPWEPTQPVSPAPPGNGISALPNDDLIRIAYYTALRSKISSIATYRYGDSGISYGTPTNPQVLYIDHDWDMGPEADNGAGILLVTGDLTIHGNPSYTGLILMIGDNKTVTFSGGGMGTLTGSMVVANIHPWTGNATCDSTCAAPFVSAPNFNGNGGSTTWGYGGGTGVNNAPFLSLAPPRRITFTQLR